MGQLKNDHLDRLFAVGERGVESQEDVENSDRMNGYEVPPYADGSKRAMHTAVKCNECKKEWSWGLSWDGSKDGEFVCPTCKNPFECDLCHGAGWYEFEIPNQAGDDMQQIRKVCLCKLYEKPSR